MLLAFCALGGCSESAEDKAKAKYFECKNHVGKDCSQQNREESNEKEAEEAQDVLKKRRAEELANAAEGRSP